MFKKKINNPVALHLSFNLDEIEKFIKTPFSIKPEKEDEWEKNSDIKTYKITYIGENSLLFYHNDAGDFSTSINGREYLNNSNIKLEWDWGDVKGHIALKANDKIILLVPDDKIIELIKSGLINMKGKSYKNLIVNGEIISNSVGLDHVSEVRLSYGFDYGLMYSNSLASFSAYKIQPRFYVDYNK